MGNINNAVAIDLEIWRNAAQVGHTREELATIFGCSISTIISRMLDPVYREAYDAGRSEGKASIRRMLWNAARAGDGASLRLLAKHELGIGKEEKPDEPDPQEQADLEQIRALVHQAQPTQEERLVLEHEFEERY